MNTLPRVILAEPLPAEPEAWLAARCELVRCAASDPRYRDYLAHAQGLVVRTATRVDAATLDAAPNLRVVGRAGVGLDTIDVAACRRRDVTVVHTPDANAQAVVEYVFWLIGDALRPRTALRHGVDSIEWERARAELSGARQFSECTLGILGLGRIGRKVANVARAFGVRTLYCDLLEIPTEARNGADPVAFDELLRESDILSIHVDGRTSNRGLLDARALRAMRENAILINTARGLVIDDGALATILRERPSMLALLDVHEPEPVAEGHPLLSLPNCRLFPHLASRTKTAVTEMAWVVRDVVAVLNGDAPRWEAGTTEG